LTVTGSRVAAGCCARAASMSEQLQKAMPAAAPFMKVLRVVMEASLFCTVLRSSALMGGC
jgi:hypothetical protein